ncbi:MAG: hypothetical protein RLZ75_1816 [Pseudomonadota bacterium]|jgi:purine-binding chemotaxis protein CheW
MNSSVSFVTFYLGGLYFGITAKDVLEVNRNLEITPVPKSPKIVRGIMNLRGQLVPAIDMYERLGLQIQSNKIEAISIILQCDGFLIALLVDDIGEILSFNDDAFEPPPSNFPLISRELIIGAYKLPERLILILDQKLIAVQQSSKEIVNYTSSS